MNRLQPLEPGDVVCDQCNGTGEPGNNKIGPNDKLSIVPWYCDKCDGTGKLDWIENITGRRKPKLFSVDWGDDFLVDSKYRSPTEQKAIEQIAQKLADQIDQDILKGIRDGIETGTWRSNL
jgi:hypothetical protein